MQYSKLEQYFKSRFEELLNKRTPDSCRVRHHNVLSILKELCELIEGWQKRRIQSPETVIYCVEECVKLIKEDAWIDYSFYDKKLLLDDMDKYIIIIPESKDKRESIYEASSKLKYVCRKCISCNSSVYAKNLFMYLIGEINKPGDMDEDGCYIKEMESFDRALSFLCSELLRIGHSKNHLYMKAHRLLEGKININNLKDQLLAQDNISYEVIYKFQSYLHIDECKNEYGFCDNVDEIKSKLENPQGYIPFKNFLTPNRSTLYKVLNVEALDTYAAIKKAKNSMALLLDTLHLGNSMKTIKFDSNVLVLSKATAGRFYSELRNHDYQLDGTYKFDPDMSKRLKSYVNDILDSTLVKDDAKDRLKSALRHFRMANDSNDIELRFVNYWIALEFIFSSPISNENTFVRIKKHLVNILCYSYIARNTRYLDGLLHKDGVLSADKSLIGMTDAEWGSLIDNITDTNTQYRLCQMKSHLHSKNDIEKYIAIHKQNLEWHITRIYRMRNELIHEAALKQDIEGATSNLRFYLVFVLNQLINYFHTVSMPVSINNFFHDFENKTNIIWENKDRNYVLNAEYEALLLC